MKEYLTKPLLLSKLDPEKKKSLYLVVSMTIVSVALIQENGIAQLPLCYASHSKVPTDIRYPDIKKLAFVAF